MRHLSLSDAVNEWLGELQLLGRSENTITGYREYLKVFAECRWDGDLLPERTGRYGDRPVESFRREDIIEFFKALDSLRRRLSRDRNKRRKLAPVSMTTRHAYARSLRAFFRWAEWMGLATEHIRFPMPKVPVKVAPQITDQQIVRMVTTAGNIYRATHELADWRNYVLTLLLTHTGMRRAEILALTVDDLEFDGDPPTILIRHGKGDKERRIVMARDLRGELFRYSVRLARLKRTHLMFSAVRRNRPLHPDALPRILQDLARSAGVNPSVVSPHRWRHAFLTRMAESGVNMVVMQEMAGHADLTTTRRYCHPGLGAQEAALDRAVLR